MEETSPSSHAPAHWTTRLRLTIEYNLQSGIEGEELSVLCHESEMLLVQERECIARTSFSKESLWPTQLQLPSQGEKAIRTSFQLQQTSVTGLKANTDYYHKRES